MRTRHRAKGSRFVDAPQDMRCQWDVTLRDGSKAQCGRRRKIGQLCTQHHKMHEAASFPCCGGTDELPPEHTMDCCERTQEGE